MPEKLQDPTPDITPPDLTYSGDHWVAGSDPDGSRWISGPEITIQDRDTSGGEAGELTSTVQVQPFTVSTGRIVEQVTSMLDDVEARVGDYNEMKAWVVTREGWIFSVSDESDIGDDGNPYSGEKTTKYKWVQPSTGNGSYQAYEGYDDYFGASKAQVTQLNTYQHQLLTASADLITLVGQYIYAVDGAAQAYANIDFAAQFPDPPVIKDIFG